MASLTSSGHCDINVFEVTLPETNIPQEKWPSQKETTSSIPTINVQVLCSFQGVYLFFSDSLKFRFMERLLQ